MNRPCSFTLCALAALFCLLAAATAYADHASFSETAEQARTCGVFPGVIDRVSVSVEAGDLSEEDGSALLGSLLEACTGRLPLVPFEDKLDEGLAKRVAPSLIVRVLERKLEAYRFARRLLSGRSAEVAPELLVVMGEGVSQGTPQADLEAYVTEFSTRPQASFLTGAHMVCLLGQSAFDYQLTRSMLREAFENGGPADEWRYFIRIVLVARKRGLDDADIAEAARQVLGRKGALRDVSSRLGFTSRSLKGQPDSE